MSYLEQLLQGQTVEWKALGEVVKTIAAPTKLKKSMYQDTGKTAIIDQGIDFIAGYTDDNVKAIPTGEYIIFGDHSEHIKYVNFSFVQGADGLKILKLKNQNTKYIYYAFKNFYQRENNYKRHWSSAKETKIPLPPLETQQNIVKILDKMTALTAELTAELSLRQQQYQYYRDKLLTFGDTVQWVTLGEVAKNITSGGTPRTGVTDYYGGDIPWLRTQEVNFGEIWDTGVKITEQGLKNSSAKWIPKNCVIIAMYGATVGKVGINKIPMATNQACANIELDENLINYKYVFYYLASQYEYIKSLGSGSQTNINAGIVKKLKIPLPPLETQQNIVNILDTFDTLTQSISEGLPHEIALRQKQYEYYREQLLDFKHNSDASDEMTL